ncbi:hypothetical protein [Puniceibacterium confluentis]|nr:hypothetical protein [Puniceibacterium confluentis]
MAARGAPRSHGKAVLPSVVLVRMTDAIKRRFNGMAVFLILVL